MSEPELDSSAPKLHDVRVNLIRDTGRQWRLSLDGLDLDGVTDVKIEQSFDTPIKLTVTMNVNSVKGFNES